MKKGQWGIALLLVVVLVISLGSAAFAFDDVDNEKDQDKIMALKERGILQGNGNSFFGERKLTNAEGVHMIVKGMDLSLAAFLFIKEPLATDSFDHIPNDAWYAQSFVIASVNGLELARELDPKAHMTREAYIHHLYTALMLKGDYPFTKRLFHVADEADMNPDYRYSLQLLLNGGMVQLDESDKFEPKREITRREAAVMLYDVITFMERHATPIPDDGISIDGPVTLETEKVTEDILKVTVSRGEMPHAGYGISVARIVFTSDNKAEIYYQLSEPDPDRMYAQVITTPTAVTYVPAQYEVVLMASE